MPGELVPPDWGDAVGALGLVQIASHAREQLRLLHDEPMAGAVNEYVPIFGQLIFQRSHRPRVCATGVKKNQWLTVASVGKPKRSKRHVSILGI